MTRIRLHVCNRKGVSQSVSDLYEGDDEKLADACYLAAEMTLFEVPRNRHLRVVKVVDDVEVMACSTLGILAVLPSGIPPTR